MSLIDVYDAIARGGVPFLLLAIGWAGYKRVWTWGYQLEEAQKRADKFEQLALGNLHIAATATEAIVAERSRGTGA